MTEIIVAIVAALVGGGGMAWRLRAGRSLMELGRAIVNGGGPGDPKPPV